ncbi:hypothetical protein M0812_02036 [Anaeramoeba flamelloides]|uniref:Uncharacterized protein n=1 Tax=Anaeramoeba flamelloides TaxID=1746091 RepID=A0AAV7Z2S6_9EUKA|nr:hypothetical protein M0812_02036 [Anaeramoeba flamelloides]
MTQPNLNVKNYFSNFFRVKRRNKLTHSRSCTLSTAKFSQNNSLGRITQHIDLLYEQLYDLRAKKEILQNTKFSGEITEKLQQSIERLKSKKKENKSLQSEITKIHHLKNSFVQKKKNANNENTKNKIVGEKNKGENWIFEKEKTGQKTQNREQGKSRTALQEFNNNKNLTKKKKFFDQNHTHSKSNQDFGTRINDQNKNRTRNNIKTDSHSVNNNCSQLTLSREKTEHSKILEENDNKPQKETNQNMDNSNFKITISEQKIRLFENDNQESKEYLNETNLLDLFENLESKYQKQCSRTKILQNKLKFVKTQRQSQEESNGTFGNQKMQNKKPDSLAIKKQKLVFIEKKCKKIKFEITHLNQVQTNFLRIKERLKQIQTKYLAQQKEEEKLKIHIQKLKNPKKLNTSILSKNEIEREKEEDRSKEKERSKEKKRLKEEERKKKEERSKEEEREKEKKRSKRR